MKILALDISTKAGFALLEGEKNVLPKLVEYGLIANQKAAFQYGGYPFGFLFSAEDVINRVFAVVMRVKPDVIVIEETNLGKNRYSQKLLEFLHCSFLRRFHSTFVENHHEVGWKPNIYYISSSMWRTALGLQMSKLDKKNNAKLSKAKRVTAETGRKLDKASLGITGRITKKHLSVRYVNEQFTQSFKMKDNDVTDAICLGTAYLMGAEICDGVM